MTTGDQSEGPQRRATDGVEALIEIRRQELARLTSIDENNRRLAEATEALIAALNNFATKDEVNAKVDAVKETAVRADVSRTVVLKRVTFGFIVVSVFILAGMVSTGLYVYSQHRNHVSSYKVCLDRNRQTDAFRTFLQTEIERGSKVTPTSPVVKDLSDLLVHYPAVHCVQQWP
jgi:hypothetical protein